MAEPVPDPTGMVFHDPDMVFSLLAVGRSKARLDSSDPLTGSSIDERTDYQENLDRSGELLQSAADHCSGCRYGGGPHSPALQN